MQRAQPWPCTRNLGVLRLPRPRLLPVLHSPLIWPFLYEHNEQARVALNYPNSDLHKPK